MSTKKLLILACLVPLGLLIPACDFPTESDEETQVSSSVQSVNAASEAGSGSVTLSGPSKLQIGNTASISFTVNYQRGDASEPLPTQLGLSTNLGNFGNAEGGPTTTTPALSFTNSSSCQSCVANGQVSFYAGSTTGAASVVASVGGATQTLPITIAKPTALFINSLSPGFGAASGGTRVTISGQGFPSATDTPPRVSFGSIQAQIVSTSATSIVVNTPASPSEVTTGSTLVVDVKVDVAATDVTEAQTDTLSGAFTYTTGGSAPPQLPSIRLLRASTTQTNAGDNAGGYQVIILGTNFIAPVTVKVGSGSSVSSFSGVSIDSSLVNVNNGGQVTISSWPAATQDQLNGSVDVLLQNDSSGLGTVAQGAFSYQSPDVVVNASPTSTIYYDTDTAVTITARGLDLSSSATQLDTTRYKLEIGGEEQCSPASNCKVTSISNGTFTFSVSPLASVTLSSCADQTGPVMFTDRVTTETAAGPTFSYEVDKPVISQLTNATGSESGGTTLTISGTFSSTELQNGNGQVLINGQSATFTNNCSTSPGSCDLTVTVPAFTGSFDTASCTSDGETGTQNQNKKVDVEVVYQGTTCSVTRSSAYTYEPTDTTCQVSTSAPTAGFSHVVSPSDPLTVQFIDQSSDASSVEWFFGDTNSFTCPDDQALPCTTTHTYDTANFYTVTQQVRNSAGSDTATQTVQAGEAPDAAISGPTTATTGDTVTFFNNTTGIDSGTTCEWDWGDDSSDFTCGSGVPLVITHTYSTAGTYTIVFKATNGLGNDTTTAQIVVSD